MKSHLFSCAVTYVNLLWQNTALINRPELFHTVKVITLVEYLKQQGHNLYTDRFYTSPVLAGPIRDYCNNNGDGDGQQEWITQNFKKERQVARGTVTSFRDGKKMVLSWMDKRNILMLSTKYSNNTLPPR